MKIKTSIKKRKEKERKEGNEGKEISEKESSRCNVFLISTRLFYEM